MGDRLYKKIAKVSMWRDTVPAASTSFASKQLTPGQQLNVTDLRIKFKIERSLTKTPNQADIYISNLARDTRSGLVRPLTVQLSAGYDDIAHLLFVGDLHFGMSEQKGASWETLLQCGDGDRAYNYARVSRSYAPGTTYRTVLKDAAASMGFTLPSALDGESALDEQFAAGTTSVGPSRDELTRLLAPFGYRWSIQDNRLLVVPDGGGVVPGSSPGSVIPIDEAHGMIGTPEFGSPPRSGKPPHVKVKMELYPEIAPGDYVKVTSESTNGIYQVEKLTHTGDTHSPQWETVCEILPVAA